MCYQPLELSNRYIIYIFQRMCRLFKNGHHQLRDDFSYSVEEPSKLILNSEALNSSTAKCRKLSRLHALRKVNQAQHLLRTEVSNAEKPMTNITQRRYNVQVQWWNNQGQWAAKLSGRKIVLLNSLTQANFLILPPFP